MIIAIDGPAASGKGTLARRLAAYYGFHHLDTGLTYRGVAAALIAAGEDPADEAAAVRAARRLDLGRLDPVQLADHAIGEAASKVAVIGAVRTELTNLQRAFARKPPGAVLDGRDIGTVVCPEAPVKLFVTASPEARAGRRTEELRARGQAIAFDEVLDDLRRRDARDAGRSVAPLRQAADAHLLDTTGMDIEAAFRAALEIVERAKTGRH